MENSTDWAASTLFSPSKARAQQAQAKDWVSVDSWLSKRYASKRCPPLERNEDTLQSLLTLATYNETADEQRGHIDRVEKAALHAYSKRSPQTAQDIHSVILSHLKDQGSLNALAEATINLESPSVDLTELAAAVTDLTSTEFELAQQAKAIDVQESLLKALQARLNGVLSDLEGNNFQASSELPQQTLEWIKSTKHLKAKVGEYEERLNALRSSSLSTIRIDEVSRQQEDLAAQKLRLVDINTKLKAFKSLPTEAGAARRKLESARDELRKLTLERDRLFERLADEV